MLSAFSSLRASKFCPKPAARRMGCVFQLYSGCVPDWRLLPAHSPLIYTVQNITLNSHEAFSSFMRYVPKLYFHHIRSLSLCLKPSSASSGPIDQTSALIDVLSSATRVESLSLHFVGSPEKSIVPQFQNLPALRSLHVSNCGDEETQPLYAPSFPSLLWYADADASYYIQE